MGLAIGLTSANGQSEEMPLPPEAEEALLIPTRPCSWPEPGETHKCQVGPALQPESRMSRHVATRSPD